MENDKNMPKITHKRLSNPAFKESGSCSQLAEKKLSPQFFREATALQWERSAAIENEKNLPKIT